MQGDDRENANEKEKERVEKKERERGGAWEGWREERA